MSRLKHFDTAPVPERAVLVGVDFRQSAWPLDRSLDELERLVHTAGGECVARITQKLDHPSPKTFIGPGKLEELKGLVDRLDAQTVIFDDELTPAQQSNLERALGEPIKVIDHTALILDIFGLHARTSEGRLQVQLAQLQYLLPRLRGMWSHLAKEQTRGGIGSRFGQGESQLEVDRRLIRSKISSLRKQLKNLQRRRDVQAKGRMSSNTFKIALAGYTNAGKSSLLNILTGSDVLSQNKLFATLDPTTRSHVLPGGRIVTITDTVGFIQKLPHGLVDAFRSTLSEVLEADLILKVVDISDEDWQLHLDAVDNVLQEIGADERRSITILNKIDLLDNDSRSTLPKRNPEALCISTRSREGLNALTKRIAYEASSREMLLSIMLPYAQGALASKIHQQAAIISEDFFEDGIHVVLRAPDDLVGLLAPYEIG